MSETCMWWLVFSVYEPDGDRHMHDLVPFELELHQRLTNSCSDSSRSAPL